MKPSGHQEPSKCEGFVPLLPRPPPPHPVSGPSTAHPTPTVGCKGENEGGFGPRNLPEEEPPKPLRCCTWVGDASISHRGIMQWVPLNFPPHHFLGGTGEEEIPGRHPKGPGGLPPAGRRRNQRLWRVSGGLLSGVTRWPPHGGARDGIGGFRGGSGQAGVQEASSCSRSVVRCSGR